MNKVKEALYSVALDDNQEIVSADTATKGESFSCIVCKSVMTLKKSGNTGKGSKRPHFAHKSLTPNCTPETALHYAFKIKLAKRIEGAIDSGEPIDMSWKCDDCRLTHSGNLMKRVAKVAIEHGLDECRPDIALFDKDNNVFAVIEVVVTHEPEEKTLEYYMSNNIILIQINVDNGNDLDSIDNNRLSPDKVSICYNPKCVKCNKHMETKILMVIGGKCWKCNSSIQVAAIRSSNGSMIRGVSNFLTPSDFTNTELTEARRNGVYIKSQYSKTMSERYLSNSCRKCNAFIGDHYMFTDYISPAQYGDLKYEEYNIGHYCAECND